MIISKLALSISIKYRISIEIEWDFDQFGKCRRVDDRESERPVGETCSIQQQRQKTLSTCLIVSDESNTETRDGFEFSQNL